MNGKQKGRPTLVLIHGICCHGDDWKGQEDAFGQTMEVLAPTLPGHRGDATPPQDLTIGHLAAALTRQLDAAAQGDVILCGHSLGCRVALELAVQTPSRVRGIILVDGSNTVQGPMEDTLAAFDQIEDVRAWFYGVFDQMFRPDCLEAEQAMYRDRIARMPVETLKAIYRNMILWDGTKLDGRLRAVASIPLLALQSTDRAPDGSRRWLKPGERSRYLEKTEAAHPDCQIITYPDHGHFLHLEAPDQFAVDVMEWMADKTTARASETAHV